MSWYPIPKEKFGAGRPPPVHKVKTITESKTKHHTIKHVVEQQKKMDQLLRQRIDQVKQVVSDNDVQPDDINHLVALCLQKELFNNTLEGSTFIRSCHDMIFHKDF